MARRQLAISLNGSTFKILYIYYCAYLMDKSIGMENFGGLGMSNFYGRGSPVEIGWNALNKAFKYLRSNGLITRAFYWGKYTISERGIQVLYETLLKRQELGLTYEIDGICLVADPDTKKIIVKE